MSGGPTTLLATAGVADTAGSTTAAAPTFDHSVTAVAARIRAFMVRSSLSTVGAAHGRGRRSPTDLVSVAVLATPGLRTVATPTNPRIAWLPSAHGVPGP